MTSMLDIHRNARDSLQTLIHEFMASYRNTTGIIYAFFEGREDPCFYIGALQGILAGDWSIRRWCAGTKERVYQLHATLDWSRFNPHVVLFFVDRDLSDILQEPHNTAGNIYVTDNYSIENVMVTREMCHRILEELYGFTNSLEKEREQILTIFEQALSEFCEATSTVMGWFVLCRRNNLQPCLDNIPMRDLVSISKGKVSNKLGSSTRSVVAFCENHAQVQCQVATDDAVEKAAQAVRAGQPIHKHIRGKYVLWFLLQFTEHVYVEWQHFYPRITVRPKRHVQLGPSNAMEVLGPRARPPESLRTFVESNLRACQSGQLVGRLEDTAKSA